MTNKNNPYIDLFAGIDKHSLALVRDAFFEQAKAMALDDSYIIEEIKNDPEMSVEDLLDILELEAIDNHKLKQFIFAVRLNLKKSKISKQSPGNDMKLDNDFDAFEAVE